MKPMNPTFFVSCLTSALVVRAKGMKAQVRTQLEAAADDAVVRTRRFPLPSRDVVTGARHSRVLAVLRERKTARSRGGAAAADPGRSGRGFRQTTTATRVAVLLKVRRPPEFCGCCRGLLGCYCRAR